MDYNGGFASLDNEIETFNGTLNGFGTPIAEPDSQYAAYRRSVMDTPPDAPRPTYRMSDGYVNYADAEPQGAPSFVRSNDLYTLDPDPFGLRTEKWAAANGLPYDSNHVTGLTVFGRSMSRDYLNASDAGRRLLELEEKKRKGEKRGFLDAVTDIGLSDLPFVSLFATVGKSVSDAVTVSNTFRKLQNGEPVTDEELIKTRLYMAENEYQQEGTWGATVGDIVRAAPGFMVEFAVSGGMYSAARVGLNKAAGRGIHMGLTRASKRMARESIEDAVSKTIEASARAGANGFDTFAKGLTTIAGDDVMRKTVLDNAKNSIFRTIWDDAAGSAMNPLYKGITRDQAMDLAERRAGYEMEKLVARSGSSSAMVNGLRSYSQWLSRAMSRGIMDFGAWGTEEASVLFRKTTAGRKLAEAAEAMFVEAPIKGALLSLPGQLALKASGSVSEAELQLQQSAYVQGNRELMDSAESIAYGINLLEYVSENAGRGFAPLASAVGTGFSKLGVSKILKPVANAIHSGSSLVKESDAVKFGGRIRQWVDDVFGTRETFRARFMSQQSKLVAEDLAKKGVQLTDTAALDAALRSGVTDRLPEAVRSAIGPDIRKYSKDLFEAAYKSGRKDLEYKSMARFMLADFMTRHNIGPQTVMNMYEKMGYDGVLGEMLEERYSDVAKGMLGLDDRENHDFWSNFREAVKGLYPGFDQLTAEAVGFMVPMVTRAGTMKLMSMAGGEGRLSQIRSRLEGFTDMLRHPRTVDIKLGSLRKLHTDTLADLDSRIEAARADLAIAETAKDEDRAKGISANIADLEEQRRNRTETFDKSIGSIEAAARANAESLGLLTGKSETESAAVVEDQYITVEPTLQQESTGFRYSMKPINDPEHSRQGVAAQTALSDFAPELARLLWESEVPLEGESPSVFRTIARKAVGIAGAFVTGDLSLMAANPAQWNARDMGVERELCIALKNGFRAEWDSNRKALEQTLRDNAGPNTPPGGTLQLTRDEVTNATMASFAPKARAIVENYLVTRQIRSATQSNMLEQATEIVARSHGFDGVGSDGRLIKYAKDKGDHGEFDTEAPTAADFYAQNKDEIDKVTERIALATADIYSNRLTMSMGTEGLVPVVRLPSFSRPEHGRKTPEVDAIEDHVIYTAALQMANMSKVVTAVRADGKVPVDALVSEQAAANVNMDIVRYIAEQSMAAGTGKPDLSLVDRRALESVAKALNLRFDGTEKSLAERDEYILKLCVQANELSDPNVAYFTAPVLRDVDPRLSCGTRVTVRAVRTAEGWTLDAGARAPAGEVLTVTPKATLEALGAELSPHGFSPATTPRAVFTQARAIETEDPIVFIRDLNLMHEYRASLEAVAQGDQTRLHPLLRRNEDGTGWLYEEDSAEYRQALAIDLALASGYDASIQRVVHVPEGKTEKDVKAAYDRVWGANGYLTIAERLLAAQGVDVNEYTASRIGRFEPYSPKLYMFTPNTWRDRSGTADIYIPVDFTAVQDYTDAILNSRLLSAYATHPTLLRGALGGTISEYLRQLDALIEVEIANADSANDAELADALRMVQLQCTSAVDRLAPDGTVQRGAGMSPSSFTTLASAFALYQVERRAKAGINVTPHSRALAVLAKPARELPAFWGFSALVDLALGGSGFAAQELNPEAGPAAGQRGLVHTMSVFFNDPQALADAVNSAAPGGMSYKGFIHAVDRFLQQKARPAYVTGSAPASTSPFADLVANAATMDKYQLMLEVAKASGVAEQDMSRFFADVLNFVHETEGKASEAPESVARSVKAVKDSAEYEKADQAYVEAADRLRTAAVSVAEAEQSVRNAEDELTRVSMQEAPTEDTIVKKQEEVSTARAALTVAKEQQAKAAGDLTATADSARQTRAVTGGGNAASVLATPRVAMTRRFAIGVSDNAEDPFNHQDNNLLVTPVESALTPDSTDDLPALFSAEDGVSAQLVGLAGELMAECYGLTASQARLACNIAVRINLATGSPLDRDGVETTVKRIFPSMKSDDLLFLLDQFDRLSDMAAQYGGWDKVVDGAGPAWTSVEEDVKNDTDSADDTRQFNRSAVDEFNNQALKDFLALAQLVSPETDRNFQAFALNLRELNRRQYDIMEGRSPEETQAALARTGLPAEFPEAVKFLYKLLNPRANTEGASFNERHALHVNHLKSFDSSPETIQAYIAAMVQPGKDGQVRGRKSAMLLAYLMSLPQSVRENFTQLIANSAVCTPVTTKQLRDGSFTKLKDASRGFRAMSADTVTATFLSCVGMTKKQATEVTTSIAVAYEGAIRGKVPALTPGSFDTASAQAVFTRFADAIVAPVFGMESPLYSALTSPTLMRHIANRTNAERLQIAQLFSPLTERGLPPFVQLIQSVIRVAGNRAKGKIAAEDLEAAAVAVLATGIDTSSAVAGTHPPTKSNNRTALLTLMDMYSVSLPETIMHADIDTLREDRQSSVAVASRGVIPLISRWMDDPAGFLALCKKFYPHATEQEIARCRQDMTWPDAARTPILAKNLAKSYKAFEILSAAVAEFHAKDSPVYHVPVFAGDHASSVLLQIPKSVAPGTGAWKSPADYEYKEWAESPSVKAYLMQADAMAESLGLSLLWDDTKRSAVSSLEAPGVGTWGIRVNESGEVTKGSCRVGIVFNFGKGFSNEEMIGSTVIRGYGADRIKAVAKDPMSSTCKVHLAGTGGRFISFIKSLSLAFDDTRGRALEGSAIRAYEDLADSILGTDRDISTILLTDLDSYKVGPALSKTMQITVDGKKHKLFDYLMQRVQELYVRDGKADSFKTINAQNVEELLLNGVEFTLGDSTRPGQKFTLEDVLPGLEIRKVDSLNGGPSFVLIHDQSDLTAYTVANVSHAATLEDGRAPANHVIDALTMAAALKNSGTGTAAHSGFLDVVGSWGDAATVLNIAPASVHNVYRKALMRDAENSGIAALRFAGENAAGQFVLDEISKTIFARNRKDAALPFSHIYAPLVAAGASINRNGDVVCHAKSQMVRDTLRGAVTYTTDEAAFYGRKVRRSLCQINSRRLDFRYGWYLDETKVGTLFPEYVAQFEAEPQERRVALVLESVLSDMVSAERGGDKAQASRLRELVCSMFLDHHGTPISERGSRYTDRVSFDDLFMRNAGGELVFDRTAVQFQDQDLMYNDATGKRHVYLAGTLFGLPRTPSYNGFAWSTNVRASLPCDENATTVEQPDGNAVIVYVPGADAKVSPSPDTLAVEGCDHDGDKAALYMFTPVGKEIGFWRPPARVPGETDAQYLERLVETKLPNGRPCVTVDKDTGGYRFTKEARAFVSNMFVRSLFELSAGTDAFVETGPERKTFLGLALSDDGDSKTKADPLGTMPVPTGKLDGNGKPIVKFVSKLEHNILKPYGSRSLVEGRNLGQILTATDVTDASNDANVARAKAVSTARALHVMYASGMFSDLPGIRGVMATDPMEWLRFIYRIDGISNATFDDIKNQKCSRLGWTSGTIKALVADLLAYRLTSTNGKLPQTDAEFEAVLSRYTQDAMARGGSRWYMLKNTDAAPRGDARKVQKAVAGKFGRNGANVFDMFSQDTSDATAKFLFSCIENYASSMGAEEAQLLTASGVNAENLVKSASGLLSTMKGADELGRLYWLVQKADEAKATGETNQPELVRHVIELLQWKVAYDQLTKGEKLARTINYAKANPGDASESGNRFNFLHKDWADLTKSRNPISSAPEGVGDAIVRMHETNVKMHYLMHRLESVRAKAIEACNKDTDNIVSLLAEGGDACRAAARLLGLPEVAGYAKEELLANAQQVPYVVTALCKGHEIFKSGGFTIPKGKTYDVIEAIAREVAKVRRPGSEGADFSILDFRKGIEDTFELLYRLAVSSTENFDNPIFSYLRTAADGGFVETAGNPGIGLNRIVPVLRGSSLTSQAHLRGLVDSVVSGKSFSKKPRVHRDSRVKNAAQGFSADLANLEALLKESTKRDEIAPLVNSAKAVIAAIDSFRKTKGGTPGVTPSMMFGQLLPLYTLLTSRTLGAPQPQSPSLLAFMPRSMYEALSSGQVELEDKIPNLVYAMIARQWAPLSSGQNEQALSVPSPGDLAEIQSLAANAAGDASLTAKAVERAGKAVSQESLAERENPEHRNTFDVFAGRGVMKDVVRAFSGTGTSTPTAPEDSPGKVLAGLASGTSSGKTPNVKMDGRTNVIANALGALFGSWLTVEVTGENSFALVGNFSGNAGQGHRARILVDVGGGMALADTDPRVEQLANSYSFAASFANASGLGITPDMFFQLPLETRMRLVRRYGVGGKTLNRVYWSLDGKGIATLIGRVQIAADAKGSTAYHEMFHQMCAMFRHLGVWGVEDIAAMRDQFGPPAPGTDQLFDEEKAAEMFRKFVQGNMDKDAKKKDSGVTVRTVFQKIYDFLKGLLEILRLGFEYGDRSTPTDKTLFKMFLHGIAEQTTSAKQGIVYDGRDEAVVTDIYNRLVRDYDTKAQYDLTERQEGTDTEGNPVVRTSMPKDLDLTVRSRADSAGAPGYADELAGADMTAVAPDKLERYAELQGQWHSAVSAIDNALDSGVSVKSPEFKELTMKAAAIRAEMSEINGVDTGELLAPDGVEESAYLVAPLGTDEYKTELVRAAVNGGTFPGADVNPFYAAGKAITDACIRGWSVDGTIFEGLEDRLRSAKSYFADNRRGDQEEFVNREAVKNGLRMVMQQVNPAFADSVRGKPLEDNLVFEACLSAYQSLDSSFGEGAKHLGEYLERTCADDARLNRLKRHASAYDVAAWCLVSHGVLPGEHTEACLAKLRNLQSKAGSGAQATLKYLIRQMERLNRAVADPTHLNDFLAPGGSEVLDKIIPAVTAGLTFPKFDDRGFLQDYELAPKESESKLAKQNRRRLSKCIGDRSVQEALKTVIQTAFTCAAELKFYRETGVTPGGSAAFDAYKAIAPDGTPGPMSPGAWLADQHVGPGGLISDESLIDYYDQGYFIANNVKQWLDSHLRKSFGGREIREIVMASTHEFEALETDALRERNLLAYMLGFNVPEDTDLLKVVDVDDEYAMEHGVVVRSKVGNKAKGFNNYGKETCNVRFTKEELRTVRWYADAIKAYANGEAEVITGLDRLSFNVRDFIGPNNTINRSRFSLENLTARLENGGQLNRFEELLLRIPEQLNETIWKTGPGCLGLYDKLVDAVCTAAETIRKTPTMDPAEARDRALKDHIKNHGVDPMALPLGSVEYNNAMKTVDALATDYLNKSALEDFNGRVLRELERKGFIAAQKSDDGDYRSGVVILKVRDIDAMFKNSTAHEKLTSQEGGRNYEVEINGHRMHCLSMEALAKPLMDVWRRTCAFVKQHPWITEGDAKTLNTFRTSLPLYTGSGYFMYGCVAKERAKKRNYTESLGKYERRFLETLQSKNRNVPLSKLKNTMGTVEMLKDLYGISQTDDAFFTSLVKGHYSEGGEMSARTGLTLPADPTKRSIEDAIYAKLCDKSWEQDNHPFKRDRRSSVDSMIDAYRDSREGDMSMTTHKAGLTARAMYEKYGVLPANFDLGHTVKLAVDQVTNSIMHRNTIASLLLTPSADGTPVYYAKPSDIRAEAKSLPDEFWETVARWWAQVNGIAYDDRKSGLQNAREIYDKIDATRGKSGKTPVRSAQGEPHRYTQLPKDASDLVSIEDWLVQDDEDLGGESTMLNALGGGEAMGYLKQVCGAGRVLGFGGPMVRATVHRALSWSKAMSVSCSFFFPLATKWESPIAAVGAMATIGSNFGWAGSLTKNHPDMFNSLVKLFPGSGWITKDFLGFSDIVEMMDSHSPFIAELTSWAHALGISLSSAEANPMEPQKSVMLHDIQRLDRMLRENGMGELANRFTKVMNAMLTRQSEKAFTYALNATKLATVAQLAMKLRHQAKLRGKAFDPIRDLRRYAGYINAEVGGIDQKRYAWAHPLNRGIMNTLMFSWEWTRGAWEAGGGGVIEDLVFGGHSVTREERKFMLGRWARMYGEVMIGVPLLFQILVKAMALALNAVAGDDDDEEEKKHSHWWTWQNEDKAKWTAFDVTPLLKAMNKFEFIANLKANDSYKAIDRLLTGAGGGALLGGKLGGLGGAVIGAGAGAIGGQIMDTRIGRLVPAYSGDDQANQTTRNRRYYMHFGKQGWEFFRWFDEPGKQFFSKLSMPTQRFLEGAIGRNLAYLDRELPWEDMGAVERWINPTTDGAVYNMAKAWLPFTVNGLGTFGDAGFLCAVGPVSMGTSRTRTNDLLEAAVERWANNDRRGYQFGRTQRKGKRARNLAPLAQDILKDARANGEVDLETRYANAIGQVMSKLYNQLFKALPRDPSADYDVKEVERCCRALNRLGAKRANILQSIKDKFESQGNWWTKKLTPDQRRMYSEILKVGLNQNQPVMGPPRWRMDY